MPTQTWRRDNRHIGARLCVRTRAWKWDNGRTKAPQVVYVPNFLHKDDFKTVQQECSKLRPMLKREHDCIAINRWGCYLPSQTETVAILSSREVAEVLTQRLKSKWPLYASDFPMELRNYPRGASMPWHKDEQMYASPQWELIYTITNDSDSKTEWVDDEGVLHSEWTEPNSLVAVLAEGWEHQVTAVTKGSRSIIKLCYTCTNVKVAAYEANLTRVAYK